MANSVKDKKLRSVTHNSEHLAIGTCREWRFDNNSPLPRVNKNPINQVLRANAEEAIRKSATRIPRESRLNPARSACGLGIRIDPSPHRASLTRETDLYTATATTSQGLSQPSVIQPVFHSNNGR